MRKILVAGLAAVVLAGASGLAAAQAPDTHVMTVRLPNGMIEQIQYSGDVPPQVVLAPQPIAIASPVEMLRRMSAEMDRAMAAMFQGMPGMPGPMPGGAQSYSVAAPFAGAGVCMQSVRVTYSGNGQHPVVERHSQGDCGPAAGEPAAAPVAPAAKPAVKTIEVKAGPGDLVRPVTAWRG